MSLSADEVLRVARLARLELNKDRVEAIAGELSGILDMVGQLSKAETDNILPMAHPLDMAQRLRADLVSESDQRRQFQALAPEVDNGLYLVPKVLE